MRCKNFYLLNLRHLVGHSVSGNKVSGPSDMPEKRYRRFYRWNCLLFASALAAVTLSLNVLSAYSVIELNPEVSHFHHHLEPLPYRDGQKFRLGCVTGWLSAQVRVHAIYKVESIFLTIPVQRHVLGRPGRHCPYNSLLSTERHVFILEMHLRARPPRAP